MSSLNAHPRLPKWLTQLQQYSGEGQVATLPLISDGGLATLLERQGHDLSSSLWSARLLIEDPSAIVNAHLQFFEAGANIATTASYQASISGIQQLYPSYSRDDAAGVIRQSVCLAKTARDQYRSTHSCDDESPLLIAGSLGCYGAHLADGSEYSASYRDRVSVGELKSFHREKRRLLVEEGVDLLAYETIPCAKEVKAIAEIEVEEGGASHTPAWVSVACRSSTELNSGEDLLSSLSPLKHIPSIFGVGVNCSNPLIVADVVTAIRRELPEKVVVAYPNSGEEWVGSTGEEKGGSWKDDTRVKGFAGLAKGWWKSGAGVVGGCCRVYPEDISKLTFELRRQDE